MSATEVPRAAPRRLKIRVTGTVQGVGFRPYVYRLARELRLSGHVLNDERGVQVEVEGDADALETFLGRLPRDAPPLASVEKIQHEAELEPRRQAGFEIVESERRGEPDALVSPDTTTCDDCLRELLDPADRRYRYPFINCTNCGPRFTIVRGVPYDRPLTTMAAFEMCSACRAEYEDPLDRRFHAQPNACPECGPRATLLDREKRVCEGHPDAVAAAAAALLEGRIVAVKGLGGYHLACRADDEAAVTALRTCKHREDRPFALMVPGLGAARRLVELPPEETRLLVSRERPIVLARRRAEAPVAPQVAPRSAELGVMLPYSPLHHLLLSDCATTLVLTSGNVSDEPIAYDDGDALERLASIADLFLVHDRPIHTRTDDSVVRAVTLGARRQPLQLRRSRGYVPASIDLPLETSRPVLGCGAEQKNTFCVAKDGRAWVGHHVGDLKNFETLRSFEEGAAHFEQLFAVTPEVVAHDLHPDYLSTRYALEQQGAELVGVQHHHAHMAACLAEHGERGAALGAIYDGTGYGEDGAVWGGELLAGSLAGFDRVGTLWPVRMPGGDRAVREPWRMACAWLAAALGLDEPPLPRTLAGEVEPSRWAQVSELVRTGMASPPTTSVGRLFDAVSALAGVRAVANYEGQAAVELEGLADAGEKGAYPLPLVAQADPLLLDARETVRAAADDVQRGADAPTVGARFHNGLAEGTARACAEAASRHGLETVALSGGVFQNRLLLEHSAELLGRSGLRVLVPRVLSPNDGGIAYGQVAVAVTREG